MHVCTQEQPRLAMSKQGCVHVRLAEQDRFCIPRRLDRTFCMGQDLLQRLHNNTVRYPPCQLRLQARHCRRENDADLDTDSRSVHSVLRKAIEDFGVHASIQLRQAQQGAAHWRVPHSIGFQITLHLQQYNKVHTCIRCVCRLNLQLSTCQTTLLQADLT